MYYYFIFNILQVYIQYLKLEYNQLLKVVYQVMFQKMQYGFYFFYELIDYKNRISVFEYLIVYIRIRNQKKNFNLRIKFYIGFQLKVYEGNLQIDYGNIEYVREQRV